MGSVVDQSKNKEHMIDSMLLILIRSGLIVESFEEKGERKVRIGKD